MSTYVVPVALTLLEHGTLELECSLPGTLLLGVLILSERKLARVVVPRAEEVDGLDGGGGAESERKLSRRHVDYLLVIWIFYGFLLYSF